MRQGARGSGVVALQLALIDLGFAMLASTEQGYTLPDGFFGEETLAAVRNFQRRSALEADGVVETNTVNALDQLLKERTQALLRTDVPRNTSLRG